MALHIKQLGPRMRESVLPEIIVSVIFGLIAAGGFIDSPIYYLLSSAGIFFVYTIWFFTALRMHAKKVSRKSTYFLTNIIIIAVLAVPGVVLAAVGAVPYYYFLFYPFAALKYAGVTGLVTSTVATNAVLFLCYLIAPFTVKCKKHRSHRHKSSGGPIDTNNFIMKV